MLRRRAMLSVQLLVVAAVAAAPSPSPLAPAVTCSNVSIPDLVANSTEYRAAYVCCPQQPEQSPGQSARQYALHVFMHGDHAGGTSVLKTAASVSITIAMS